MYCDFSNNWFGFKLDVRNNPSWAFVEIAAISETFFLLATPFTSTFIPQLASWTPLCPAPYNFVATTLTKVTTAITAAHLLHGIAVVAIIAAVYFAIQPDSGEGIADNT